jgi:hypothetical protein
LQNFLGTKQGQSSKPRKLEKTEEAKLTQLYIGLAYLKSYMTTMHESMTAARMVAKLSDSLTTLMEKRHAMAHDLLQ